MIKLSIIVPVYGVEQYIEECIASLLIPERDDYEIIVVNDGTKDRSIDIINSRFSDSRIRIINQENLGLSAARNHGIREAHGQYVWMFDGDDWADTQRLPEVLDMLADKDVLVFTSHYLNYIEDGVEELRSRHFTATTGLELCFEEFYHPAPFFIYRRQALLDNKCSFVEGILHEDTLFTPTTLPYMQHIGYCEKPIYHYRQRRGSITKTISPRRIKDQIYVLDSLLLFAGHHVPAHERYRWGRAIVDSMNSLLKTSHNVDDSTIQQSIASYVNGNWTLIAYLCHAFNLNNRIMGVLATCLCGRLTTAYSILYRLRY